VNKTIVVFIQSLCSYKLSLLFVYVSCPALSWRYYKNVSWRNISNCGSVRASISPPFNSVNVGGGGGSSYRLQGSASVALGPFFCMSFAL
jgi:hypothetical protein